MKSLDLSGLVFGLLTIVSRSEKTEGKWVCKCICGNSKEILGKNLTRGVKSTKSCGCRGSLKIVVGNFYPTKSSEKVEVLERLEKDFVNIKFNDGTISKVSQGNLRVGNIRNPNLVSVWGFGYNGVGDYTQTNTFAHMYWRGMLERSYNPEYRKNHASYEGVSVCEEWHSFQNFAEWVTKQIGYGNKGYNLDKDRLFKGNKIYSPNTCILIPQELNKLVAAPDVRRGNSPVGTSTRTDLNGKYMARYSRIGSGEKEVYLGLFETAELAFKAYKKAKEAYIKERTEFWKDKIDPRAYAALINYTVEITD